MKLDTINLISELVKIPSISASSAHTKDVTECANVLNKKFIELGFESNVINTDLHPIVFATRKSKANETKLKILCYGHYDVQPPEPLEKWSTPPFEPIIKNDRIFGRGTADNKGPFSCLLSGVVEFLDKNPNAPIEFGIIVEGEEEIGSPSMTKFIKENAQLIADYDFMILSDTSSPSLEQIVVTTGLRGTGSLDVIFKGAKTDVHSGMFGGMIYNPIQAMSEVCASLHNSDGLVNIEHFYDGIAPIEDWEKAEIEKSPFNADSIKKLLGVKSLYKQGDVEPALAGRVLPTLEFTGIGGGYQGEGSKSVIAAECFCKISVRTVPPQNTESILQLVKNAIIARTPPQIDVDFIEYNANGDGYFVNPKAKGDSDKGKKIAMAFDAVEECITEVFGNKPLFLREGASIPLISDIKRFTGLDCIMVGLFNPEDNLHAPNESFNLATISKASSYYCKFFERLVKC
ncbi:MAG: M20/M25/M40 family metallo-hydrolase [Opitutales bacterium]|nr:M20/M25/M40 family metallo-hydrolase [Opitutales bacterium]